MAWCTGVYATPQQKDHAFRGQKRHQARVKAFESMKCELVEFVQSYVKQEMLRYKHHYKETQRASARAGWRSAGRKASVMPEGEKKAPGGGTRLNLLAGAAKAAKVEHRVATGVHAGASSLQPPASSLQPAACRLRRALLGLCEPLSAARFRAHAAAAAAAQQQRPQPWATRMTRPTRRPR